MTDMPAPDRITDESTLRALHDQPRPRVIEKEIDWLDKYCRQFIALSPYVCLSTANADGRCDVGPRGDAPGFVQVLDDKTLLIPDRRGNNRLDSFSNILTNPHVALLFLVPGIGESLRVRGTAELTTDPALLEPMAVEGKVPKVGLLVSVQGVYFHCAKASMRSKIWEDETRVERSVMPGLGRMVAEQIAEKHGQEIDDAQRDAADAAIADAYKTEVY